MGSEKSFESQIKTWLDKHGCFYVKFFANGYTKRGIPDILASVNGFFVGIEVKAQTGRPSDLQRVKIHKIRSSGGFAWIVYPSGWPVLENQLIKLLDGNTKNINESEVLK